MDENSLLRKILAGELHYAKLWLVCVALRGVAWDKMPFEQRELAFQAKDAAFNCLSIFLTSSEYRCVFLFYNISRASFFLSAALRYAVHDSLVTAAFSGLFLLKMASLFPAELDLGAITAQVEQLAQLLSDVAAERYVLCYQLEFSDGRARYALTLRIMLAHLRRKVGLQSGINTPVPTMPPPPLLADGRLIVSPSFIDPTVPPPFTMEELGFQWPSDRGIFSPAAIPVWLQEQVRRRPLLYF